MKLVFFFGRGKSLFFWLNICALRCSLFSFYSSSFSVLLFFFFQNFIILLICLFVCLFAHCSINSYHPSLPHGSRTFCLSNFPSAYSSTFPPCSAGGGWCGGDVRPPAPPHTAHTHTRRVRPHAPAARARGGGGGTRECGVWRGEPRPPRGQAGGGEDRTRNNTPPGTTRRGE